MIDWFQDVFGHDGWPEVRQPRGEGFFKGHHDGIVVRRLKANQLVMRVFAVNHVGVIHDHIVSEHEVSRCDRGAVRPGSILNQVDRDDQAIGRDSAIIHAGDLLG